MSNVKKLNLIYFSPTKTTETVLKTISKNLEIPVSSEYNLAKEKRDLSIGKDSLTIIGIPVYAGRVPLVVEDKLNRIKSDKSPVVIIAVYGNRHYDDALLELKDISEKCGFELLAAGAFIGEHSFSTAKVPIAQKRPDKKDLEQCKQFARAIKNKLGNATLAETIEVPGNYPYRQRNPLPPLNPVTIVENCTLCKACEEVCPTSAIDINGSVNTKTEDCIWCCACVKVCPADARIFENEVMDGIRTKLTDLCKDRNEPVWFL